MSDPVDLDSADERRLVLVLIGIPLLGNILPLLLVLSSLWPVPPGADIRPMGLAVLMVLIPFGTAVLGLSSALAAFFRAPKSRKFLSCEAFCVLGSVSPYFLATFTFNFIVQYHHLILRI